jgi:hypothetical protein
MNAAMACIIAEGTYPAIAARYTYEGTIRID